MSFVHVYMYIFSEQTFQVNMFTPAHMHTRTHTHSHTLTHTLTHSQAAAHIHRYLTLDENILLETTADSSKGKPPSSPVTSIM